MTDPSDVRATILDTVHRQLSIDHPWTVHHDDAFTWWPGGGVRQHVRAEGPLPVVGIDTWWLEIETPVWHAPDDQALAQLEGAIERLRVRTHGAAVRVDPAERRVSLVMRTYLLPASVPGRCLAIAGLGAVQARQALAAWEHAEASLGRNAAAWRDALPHPIGGERHARDEILTLPETFIQPVARHLGSTGLLDAWHHTADALRLNGFDVPLRQDDSLLTFAARLGEHDALVLLGLMHDDLTGPAVAVSTLVQVPEEPAAARALCDTLQRAALTPPSLVWTLGSWVLRAPTGDGAGLTAMHTAFLPVGLFPAGFGVPLAHSIAEQVRVWGRAIDRGSDARRTATAVPAARAITRRRSPAQQRAS